MKTRLYLIVLVCLCIGVLSACAPRQAVDRPDAEQGRQDDQLIELPTWMVVSDCASCHIVEVASGSDIACTYSLHTAISCITCHNGKNEALTQAHENYATDRQPTRLNTTEIDTNVCMTCHNSDESVPATTGSSMLTDSRGKMVNPHGLPANNEHLENIDCASCHKIHRTEPIADFAQKVCISCHHADVYECGTCHEK